MFMRLPQSTANTAYRTNTATGADAPHIALRKLELKPARASRQRGILFEARLRMATIDDSPRRRENNIQNIFCLPSYCAPAAPTSTPYSSPSSYWFARRGVLTR